MDKRLYKNLRIDTIRAAWIDYSNGVFFVTICTNHKAHLFGEIHGTQMHYSRIGLMASECINEIERHHPEAKVLNAVVMPNHVHLLLHVEWHPSDNSCDIVPNNPMAEVANRKGRCSTIVSLFKGSVTRKAHQNGIPFAWQRGFYDYVVRSQDELAQIYDYISNNVVRWATDCYNK